MGSGPVLPGSGERKAAALVGSVEKKAHALLVGPSWGLAAAVVVHVVADTLLVPRHCWRERGGHVSSVATV